MADQALAQTGALNRPAGQSSGQRHSLRYWLGRGWTTAWYCVRYALIGRYQGVPGLVDFILGKHVFKASQVRSELLALGELLAALRPERALEIGTAGGGTLLFLTHLASPLATIVSVDLPGGRFGGGYSARRKWAYRRFARARQQLHLLQGDSHSVKMLEQANALLAGQPLDYLFIDGDHRYEGVKRDFEMYGPLVRKGGLIAFHDIVEGPSDNVGGVPRFWQEIRAQHRHREFVDDPLQGGYGLGILFVD